MHSESAQRNSDRTNKPPAVTRKIEAHARMPENNPHILLLSSLIQLEDTARRTETEAELAFVMVNETLRLVTYNQAVFCRGERPGRMKVTAVSGVDRPEGSSPYILYITRVLRRLSNLPDIRGPHALAEQDLPKGERTGWREWSLGHGLWCPLYTHDGLLQGGLFFSRTTPWQDGETALLERLAGAYAHALEALARRKRTWPSRAGELLRSRVLQLVMAALLIAALFLPVRLSVLAPVEITARDPVIVSAPMDGVIKEIFVRPNQRVSQGGLLFSLDDTATRNEVEVSKKALSVARAEYMRATQKGFVDEKSRAEVLELEARIELKSAEVSYADEVLQRSRVRAEHSGIAVFTDVNDWLGKPVVTGERVMTIADQDKAEAEIMLPVADAINLDPGAEVLVFLNTQPDRPLPARLSRASYEAEITPVGELAFRLKAALTGPGAPPRIGLRGTAKIYGEEVTLFFYLLRKPLTALRMWAGW